MRDTRDFSSRFGFDGDEETFPAAEVLDGGPSELGAEDDDGGTVEQASGGTDVSSVELGSVGDVGDLSSPDPPRMVSMAVRISLKNSFKTPSCPV